MPWKGGVNSTHQLTHTSPQAKPNLEPHHSSHSLTLQQLGDECSICQGEGRPEFNEKVHQGVPDREGVKGSR